MRTDRRSARRSAMEEVHRTVAPGSVALMSDRSRKIAKPAAAVGVVATMASIWWFALRPRRKVKLDK
jgi:hypothetical protein